jgi:macrolide-specific efflux system membrane fusion protein
MCAAAIIISAALSGCSLLPLEDEPLPPPVLNPYERQQMTLVSVRRDDLVQTKTISCRSRPVREQSYSFPVGGIYIDRIYFSVGDAVKAGDMLAELERKDVLNQVEEAKIAVRMQEYALEQAKDDTSLQRELYRMQSMINSAVAAAAEAAAAAAEAAAATEATATAADTTAATEATAAAEAAAAEAANIEISAPVVFEPDSSRYGKMLDDYNFNVSYAEKKLEIAERKLDILLEMADERVIYATIDGVVSYAQRFSNEDRSVAGDKVFTISDTSELVYVVTGDEALFFTPGEVYPMKISKSFIDMIAVSPEDYGEPPSKDPVIYFIPTDLTAGLASYGYISVEINRRDGALYLPAAAIIQVGDEFAVYRVGEMGFRELSKVEKGVTISGKTEILSGLSEGDEVILD